MEEELKYWALVDEDGTVLDISYGSDEWRATTEENWIETSPHVAGGKVDGEAVPFGTTGPLGRANYANIGGKYDAEHDIFWDGLERPHASWAFNWNTGFYEAPIAYPADGILRDWNETYQRWMVSDYNFDASEFTPAQLIARSLAIEEDDLVVAQFGGGGD